VTRTRLIWLLLLLTFSGSAAFGQVTAAISGTVKDASGGTVGGAAVTVKSLETGLSRVTTTDRTGEYKLASLPLGAQEVTVEKDGFKKAVRTGIHLIVGQDLALNFRLEVGELAQEVTLTSEGPLVNTTPAEVAGFVGGRAVKDLPLNGRSWDNLITLNPGTIDFTLKSANTTTSNGNTFSVAGRRPMDNLVLLNGIEYTGASLVGNTPGGVSGGLLGIDAVREFNLLTDTYSAQYGKRSGGQLNVVTQSGTNVAHGSAFEFLRNSALEDFLSSERPCAERGEDHLGSFDGLGNGCGIEGAPLNDVDGRAHREALRCAQKGSDGVAAGKAALRQQQPCRSAGSEDSDLHKRLLSDLDRAFPLRCWMHVKILWRSTASFCIRSPVFPR